MENKRIVIAGAGVMGASLAQLYARAGYDTVLYDVVEAGLEKGRHQVMISQETMVSEGILTPAESDELINRISFTLDKNEFRKCDIVLECIIENMKIKQDFWYEVSRLAPADALLATNTSGLHVSEIATAVEGPERFMGQHWLYPPHILSLCEIIQGDKTTDENVAKMRKLVEGINAHPVAVKDINGFIINRIQFAVLREALHIVEMGAATFEDVDTVLKSGMGVRYAVLGPFGIADHGGLDTFDHINSYLNAELADSKVGSPILHKLVEEGRFGVKSGAGFYDYSGDKADQAIKERDKKYIELAKVLYFNK